MSRTLEGTLTLLMQASQRGARARKYSVAASVILDVHYKQMAGTYMLEWPWPLHSRRGLNGDVPVLMESYSSREWQSAALKLLEFSVLSD